MTHIVRYRRKSTDPFTSDVCHNGYIAALNHASQVEHIFSTANDLLFIVTAVAFAAYFIRSRA